MTAPENVECQAWLTSFTDMTRQACTQSDAPPVWSEDLAAITSRWQRAVESVSDSVFGFENGLTEAEIVEIGLLAVKTSIDRTGWVDKGLSFIMHDPITDTKALIDVREMQSEPAKLLGQVYPGI